MEVLIQRTGSAEGTDRLSFCSWLGVAIIVNRFRTPVSSALYFYLLHELFHEIFRRLVLCVDGLYLFFVRINYLSIPVLVDNYFSDNFSKNLCRVSVMLKPVFSRSKNLITSLLFCSRALATAR